MTNEPILLEALNKAIMEAEPKAELYSFSRASQLLSAMQNGTPAPDYAFLDIELPGMGGIELAKRLKMSSPKTWIVFVTAFSQYAVEAWEMHALGYVMKPVTAERIKFELNHLTEYNIKRIENAAIGVPSLP